MKSQTLPVKRRNLPRGLLKRLSAVTVNRKQRVAATTAEMEVEDSGSKISRALTIIFLIHIVAIGLIFVHQKFLDHRAPDDSKTAKSVKQSADFAVTNTTQGLDLPRIAPGEKSYIARQGDNYARIAAAAEVEEGELRTINKHIDIRPGRLLTIPQKRIAAVEPEEVASSRSQTSFHGDGGLVEALPIDSNKTTRAKLVKPNINHEAASGASDKSYVVQNGDTVWKIANRFKVNQDTLMKANGISDARKMKVGMNLAIPN